MAAHSQTPLRGLEIPYPTGKSIRAISSTRSEVWWEEQTEEKRVRKKLQAGKYLVLETRKDGTKLTSRAFREAAESLQSVSRAYDDMQHQLVDEVSCVLLPVINLVSHMPAFHYQPSVAIGPAPVARATG